MSDGIIRSGCNKLGWLVDLLIRLTMFHVFFTSGWHKWTNWDATLKLFQSDYAVSFVSANTAALIGTGAEMVLGVFLLFGLLSRFSALGLLIINTLTTIYYPPLQTEIDHAHLLIHCYWSLLLLVTVFHGPGGFSLDALFCKMRRKKA
jgi:putative oxidoreductase